MPETHDSDALRGRVVGGYRLEAVLGEGATGAVYLGRRLVTTPPLVERTGLAPLALPDEAAIKLLLAPMRPSASMQAELRRRFLREAATLQQLRHPHIVPVLTAGEDEASGLLYMVLPLLRGGTLGKLLARQAGPLPNEQIASILDDVAAALDYAHAHGEGIIHRDIKPANILLDDQGHASLSDFSIARLLAAAATQLTTTRQIVGTPEYMAPEQAQNHAVEGTADIYSLGVVLYEMVTGQLPFQADSPVGMAMLHVQQEPRTPRALRPDLPEPAEAAILKALEKRPAQRFATATAFARAFSAGLAGQWTPGLTTYVAPAAGPAVPAQGDVITVRQAPPPPPIQKWRLPIIIGSLLLLSTLLVTGTLAAASQLGIGIHSTSAPTEAALATHTPFSPTVTVGPGTPTPTPRPGQPTPTLAPGQSIPPTPPGQPTPIPATNPTATAGPAVAIYGDGSDGPLTVSSNIVDAPLDATCAGSAGTTSLSFANASGPFAFLSGKPILIHQTQGAGAGTWMRNKIVSTPGALSGTITLESTLNATYSAGCQVIVLRQYTDVTVSAGATWSVKPWDGTKGGILAFLANGTVTVDGTITASGTGFRGADAVADDSDGKQGEGHTGNSYNGISRNANGSGGGGGWDGTNHPGPFPFGGGGGGGGGNANLGGDGVTANPNAVGGAGGDAVGTPDISTMSMGGGGGSGGHKYAGSSSGAAGRGGGVIYIAGTRFVVNGSVAANGFSGGNATGGDGGGGGGGAGGSVLLRTESANGTARVAAGGASGGMPSGSGGSGGSGAVGRVFIG